MSCGKRPSGMVGWEDFLVYVKGVLPKVPDEMAGHFLRTTAIELAQDTLQLEASQTWDVQKDVHDYAVALPDAYRPAMIKRVWLDGVLLQALDVLPEVSTDERGHPCYRGCVYGYYYDAPDTVYVFPGPCEDKAGALVADFAVIPSRNTCFIDQRFFDEYAQAIADGALAHLYKIKSSDWFDLTLAGVHFKAFVAAKHRAKARRIRHNSTAPLVMKTRRFI